MSVNLENARKKRQMNPNSLANLRKDGNPKGRPKIDEALKKRIRNLTPLAVDTLEAIMRDGGKPSDRIRAAEIILDRAWGKALQPIDADINNNILLVVSEL
jgi:hypothetical protein